LDVGERLEGKVALITGVASGIGKATAEMFLREGAMVVGADIQDVKGAQMQAELGPNFRYVRCDVLVEAEIAQAVEAAVAGFGRLDILFNNAGAIGPLVGAHEVTADGFDFVMRLHVLAALLAIKSALPHLTRTGGSIVSTASVAAFESGWGPILYAIAKAGVVQMTRVAANQLGPSGVRVNCICPGLIATPIFAEAFGLGRQAADASLEGLAQAISGAQPFVRGGRPEDIAQAALYLASDEARFVNGHALVVDGGLLTGPTQPMLASVFGPILESLGAGAV
jgi:NAD(P)-dependent dehydrogenase (short-subunit alcohol dehydrogenase family)